MLTGYSVVKRLSLCLLLLIGGCSSHHAPSFHQPVSHTSIRYIKTSFSNLPNWPGESPVVSLQALLQSCRVLAQQPNWQLLCKKASLLNPTNSESITYFFEAHFTPWQVDQDTNKQVLITAYYEPLLEGTTTQTARTPYPVYGLPTDMLLIHYPPNLHALSQCLIRQNQHGQWIAEPKQCEPKEGELILYPRDFPLTENTSILRARIHNKQLVPYYTRREINEGFGKENRPILAWVQDLVELAYLQIQGSGRIKLENNQIIRLGYAAHNGHPYLSIAHWLIKHNHIPLSRATMKGIKNWVHQNPSQRLPLMNINPNYIFFKKMDHDSAMGPIGALGIPLTDGYSVAVDPNYIPLGTPIYLSSTYPLSNTPLNRLTLAQDTGSAIQGARHIDLFWGSGETAGQYAEKAYQRGRIWLLLPQGLEPNQH